MPQFGTSQTVCTGRYMKKNTKWNPPYTFRLNILSSSPAVLVATQVYLPLSVVWALVTVSVLPSGLILNTQRQHHTINTTSLITVKACGQFHNFCLFRSFVVASITWTPCSLYRWWLHHLSTTGWLESGFPWLDRLVGCFHLAGLPFHWEALIQRYWEGLGENLWF